MRGLAGLSRKLSTMKLEHKGRKYRVHDLIRGPLDDRGDERLDEAVKSLKTGNLVWIDLEMTGLDTDRDSIIEIATIVTDAQLNVLAEGPSIAVHQPERILMRMDDWNRRQHTRSGLIERVRCSTVSTAQAEQQTLDFIDSWVRAGESPMCGNSICQDRRFLHRCMPRLEAYFHYRLLDVSTLKILARNWFPGISAGLVKDNRHRALDDIRDSIAELRYYRQHLFIPGAV